MSGRRLRQAVFVVPAAAVIAERRGFFADRGLDVVTTLVPSSTAQRADLAAGTVDVAVTATDNLFVWDAEGDDVLAVGQIETTTDLALLMRPGLSAPDALRALGRVRVGVDAPTNGFAVVAYAMMRRLGLDRAEYDVVDVGGVAERFDALARGEVDLTLVAPPLDEVGLQRGMQVAMRVSEIDAAYPGLTVVARRTTIDSELQLVADYLAAIEHAVTWMRTCSPEDVRAELEAAGFGPAAIASVLRTLPGSLVPPRTGLDALLSLRAEVDMTLTDAPEAAAIVDLRPLRTAGLATSADAGHA